MNFNTFFLDKLSTGSQSVNSSSGKNAFSTFMFSDIMKVYEKENGIQQKSGTDLIDPNPVTKEVIPLPANVIECSDIKLKTLSDFINSFTANSQEPINISESKIDLNPVVIKKEQFLLSASGMEDFLKGLIVSININYSADIKMPFALSEGGTQELTNVIADLSGDGKTPSLPQSETNGDVETDTVALNVEAILHSILSFISNNKSLSLSFKSEFGKVNINIYELPEDNFETKINLEKLASDFMVEGKKLVDASTNFSNEITSEETSQTIIKLTENTPAEYLLPPSEGAEQLPKGIQPAAINPEISLKSFGFNITGYGNVYKTEIIEIAYKPSVISSSTGAAVQQKAEKVSFDSSLLSGVTQDDSEISDAKFRLTKNLSAQLSVDTNADKNISESTKNISTQETFSKPTERQEDVQSAKLLLNELKGKLVNVEFKKSLESDTPLKHELSSKTLSAQIPEQSANNIETNDKKSQFAELNGKLLGVDLKRALGKDETIKNVNENKGTKLVNAGFKKSIESDTPLKYELSSKTPSAQIPEQSANNVETNDKKSQFTELNGKLLGVDLKRASGKDETIKNVKENEGTKSASGDYTKENEETVVNAEKKTSDGKNSEKHKSNEGFKNILQAAEPVKSNNPEIFKINTELKTTQEAPKTINTQEIIPEFTKILQNGEKQSMTFQLTPENLGKVKLIVELAENKIVTRIEVENEQVKQFIQSNVEQLKQNLQSSGIQLSSVNISLTESEQKFSKAFSPRKKMGEKVGKVKEVEDQTRPAQKSFGYNTYEFLA